MIIFGTLKIRTKTCHPSNRTTLGLRQISTFSECPKCKIWTSISMGGVSNFPFILKRCVDRWAHRWAVNLAHGIELLALTHKLWSTLLTVFSLFVQNGLFSLYQTDLNEQSEHQKGMGRGQKRRVHNKKVEWGRGGVWKKPRPPNSLPPLVIWPTCSPD